MRNGEAPPFPLEIITTIAVASIILIVVAVVLVAREMKATAGRRQEMRQQKEREEKMYERLKINWSNSLKGFGVGGLSHMPPEWRTDDDYSGIVPKFSEGGHEIDKKLKEVSVEIMKLSSRKGHGTVSALKQNLCDFMDREVTEFFTRRDEMYRRFLLHDGPHTIEPSLFKYKVPWPENTTPLFRQIMFLITTLDSMFKNSYGQRFKLCVEHTGMPAWTAWVKTELPKLMPHDTVLTQTTSHIFDLYLQAAEVHSHYIAFFERLAEETKATWKAGTGSKSLKNMFRALEKTGGETSGGHADGVFDCSKIFDIVRGTLIYNTMGDEDGGVLRGVRALFNSDQFQVVRIKDRFNKPTLALWRDVLVNGRMIKADGTIISHIVEVQFHQEDLNEERSNVGGHFMYERSRALLEACELVCGDAFVRAKLKDLHNVHADALRAVNSGESTTVSVHAKNSALIHPVRNVLNHLLHGKRRGSISDKWFHDKGKKSRNQIQDVPTPPLNQVQPQSRVSVETIYN